MNVMKAWVCQLALRLVPRRSGHQDLTGKPPAQGGHVPAWDWRDHTSLAWQHSDCSLPATHVRVPALAALLMTVASSLDSPASPAHSLVQTQPAIRYPTLPRPVPAGSRPTLPSTISSGSRPLLPSGSVMHLTVGEGFCGPSGALRLMRIHRCASMGGGPMLMVPYAVVGATRSQAESALPQAPRIVQRPSRWSWVRRAFARH